MIKGFSSFLVPHAHIRLHYQGSLTSKSLYRSNMLMDDIPSMMSPMNYFKFAEHGRNWLESQTGIPVSIS